MPSTKGPKGIVPADTVLQGHSGRGDTSNWRQDSEGGKVEEVFRNVDERVKVAVEWYLNCRMQIWLDIN
jgi:hypothetical protein